MITSLARAARRRLDSRERRRLVRWTVGPLVATVRWIASRDDLHLVEVHTSTPDRPAPALVPLPDGQYPRDGHGPVIHRRYHVVLPSDADPVQLLRDLRSDPNRYCPVELAHFESDDGRITLDPGKDLVVEITGPYHGPVHVVSADDDHVRLQTRTGHLESGQSEFRFRSMATDGLLDGTSPGDLVFSVESWARSADPLMDRIYRAGPGAVAQRYLWVHLCRSVAAEAGRQGADVHVRTEWLPPIPRLAGEPDDSNGPELELNRITR